MKKIFLGLTLLVAGIAGAFAYDTSDMSSKWTCTTNASKSDVARDKEADDQMAKNQGSAKGSFEFASQHCRNCTKITCEMQD